MGRVHKPKFYTRRHYTIKSQGDFMGRVYKAKLYTRKYFTLIFIVMQILC